MLTYRWLAGKEGGFNDAAFVRETVFVEEQKFSREGEFDALDDSSLHIIGYLQENPVCTARVYEEQEAHHIGRVAVVKQYRGKGYGAGLMQEVVRKIKELGGKRAVLNAQYDKADFYERAGFTKTGNTMDDEGYPHVEMEYELK